MHRFRYSLTQIRSEISARSPYEHYVGCTNTYRHSERIYSLGTGEARFFTVCDIVNDYASKVQKHQNPMFNHANDFLDEAALSTVDRLKCCTLLARKNREGKRLREY